MPGRSCRGGADRPSARASAQDITIGAILPLTGPAAPAGIQEQQGVIFAVDKINASGGIRGRQVKVIFEDSQGKPDQGVLGFNRLVDLNKAPAIMTGVLVAGLARHRAARDPRREVLVDQPGGTGQCAGQRLALPCSTPFRWCADETRELAEVRRRQARQEAPRSSTRTPPPAGRLCGQRQGRLQEGL